MHDDRTCWLDSIDPEFGHWLAGFAAGEGCFTINYYRRSDSCSAMFTLALRDDDAAILEEIQARLGMGSIYRSGPRKSGKSKPQVRWSIQTKHDAAKLVAFFDRFLLRAKKQHDFALWRRAVEEWQQIVHGAYVRRHTDQHAGMKSLKEALTASREYGTGLAVSTFTNGSAKLQAPLWQEHE